MEQEIAARQAKICRATNLHDVQSTTELLLPAQSSTENKYQQNSTIYRYQRILTALSNKGIIEKIIRREPIQFYEVQVGDSAVGIGSLVLGQTIEHPATGQISGNEVDYYLPPEYTEEHELHKAVARQLTEQARYAKCATLDSVEWTFTINENGHRVHSRGNPVFSTRRVDDLNPALGFELLENMSSVGCIANIDLVPSSTVANQNDILEVTRHNKPIELFLTK